MLRIFKYSTRRETAFTITCLFLVTFQVFLDLRLPDYMSEITAIITSHSGSINELLRSGMYMLLCALGSLTSAIIVGFLAAKTAAGIGIRLRKLVFSKSLNFSMQELNDFSISSLIIRSTNDITQIQMIVAIGLQAIIKAPILAIWAIIKIYSKNFAWTIATGVAVIVLLLILLIIIIFAIPKSKIIQSLTDDLNRVTREHLTGLRVIKAYNAENYQQAKFNTANQKVTSTNLFVNRITSIMHPSMTLIMMGLSLAIYFIGAIIINNAAYSDKLILFSDMVVFSAYAIQVIMAFMMLTMIFIILPRASVSARRILEVLDTKNSIVYGSKNENKDTPVDQIEFCNVCFKYPDAEEYVLENISFTAQKGQTIAFIGPTGSGKSTLINLIPRFYDVSSGCIKINGIDIRDFSRSSIIQKIGYISQKAILFSGSVKDNIAFGDYEGHPPSIDQIKKAASISQSDEFISKMENGYESHISQGGANLSGGQKQRISIARAICKNPKIYIFDDSFSALDYNTDRILRRELMKNTADAIKFIVAQRIGTIKDADKIIVIDDGKIVACGKHKELLHSCDMYNEIALSQLSKEEL